MDSLGGRFVTFGCDVLIFLTFNCISDDELCFNSQGVTLCPAEGDYEELIFCCVKKNQAFCCSEDEKLSYFTNVKYVCGII